MFVGHLAVSLGAKALEPRTPLWALVAASFGLDLLWPLLLLAGIESVEIDPGNTAFTHLDFVSYPWSHSLATVIVWGGLAYALARRYADNGRTAILVGAVLVSHWVLDFVTHRPDLPLWPGGPEVGLGLWHSIPATILVEGALLGAAAWAYIRVQPPANATGKWTFWGFLGLTSVIWVSQPWSPPPPDSNSIAFVGIVLWLLPLWASWIDRNRTARS